MAIQDLPAPMTGTVKELLVGVGDQVSVGDELVIIESMKMEIPVLAPIAGRILEILVKEAQDVAEGQDVAIIET